MATKFTENLTPQQLDNIRDTGLNPYSFETLSPETKRYATPYTAAGATLLQGVGQGSFGALGVNMQEVDPKRTGRSFILMNKDQSPKEFKHTLAHEVEHALVAQGLEPSGRSIGGEWDKMSGDHPTSNRALLVKRLAEHAPYLRDKWGLPSSAYFSERVFKRPNPNLLEEQFASLSALEQDKNKRLTDDPYIREHVFVTPEQRAAYNALTGLRQTRLDAKDLPPYTPQPDKSDPTMMDKVKSLFKFANGGYVPQAGNNKLI